MQDNRKNPGQTQFPLWATTPGWQWFVIGVAAILALAFIVEGAAWLLSAGFRGV